MSYVWPNGKFLIFLFQFGLLVIKAMAFWEISPLALLRTQKWCLMYGQIRSFYCFPHWFGVLAVTARAFSKISLISHQKSTICLNCQNKFINLIHCHTVYTLAITIWVSQVSNTPFLCKMLCKYNYKYGYCPGCMYIGYGILVQYQIVIFSCLTLISIAFILYVM